jgi:hypothetical protein
VRASKPNGQDYAARLHSYRPMPHHTTAQLFPSLACPPQDPPLPPTASVSCAALCSCAPGHSVQLAACAWACHGQKSSLPPQSGIHRQPGANYVILSCSHGPYRLAPGLQPAARGAGLGVLQHGRHAAAVRLLCSSTSGMGVVVRVRAVRGARSWNVQP